MDAAFEVYLPVEAELRGLSFKVPVFEWGGEQHPQGEPEGSFGANFRLKRMKPYQPDGLGKMPADYQQVAWHLSLIKVQVIIMVMEFLVTKNMLKQCITMQ
jgi:hypothetical protein